MDDPDAEADGRFPGTSKCTYCGKVIGDGCNDEPHQCPNGFMCVQQCRDMNGGRCPTYDLSSSDEADEEEADEEEGSDNTIAPDSQDEEGAEEDGPEEDGPEDVDYLAHL